MFRYKQNIYANLIQFNRSAKHFVEKIGILSRVLWSVVLIVSTLLFFYKFYQQVFCFKNVTNY